MKKILLALCVVWTAAALAQTGEGNTSIVPQPRLKEGKVIYERNIQMRINVQGMDEEMARRLPRSRTDQFELQFSGNQSLWHQLPNINEEANTFEGGGPGPGGARIVMMGGGPDAGSITYHNFETGKKIQQQELDSKNYLITDSIRKLSWKLTDETKTILGYVARKATAQQYGMRPSITMENGAVKREMRPDTSQVTAWFTTDIPVPAGPSFQGNLPGLILELDINKGRIVYKAVEISPKAGTIKEPKGGRPISAEAFEKENQKVMNEMMKNMPAGGRNFRIGG